MDDNNEQVEQNTENVENVENTENTEDQESHQSIIDQAAAGDSGNSPTPPGAPESYDFSGSLPEGAELSEEATAAFSEICRSMNLTNDQANQIAAYGFQWAQQCAEAAEAARIQKMEAEKQATIKAFGSEFNAAKANIGAAVASLNREFPGFTDAINTSGLGNNEAFCRAMERVGKMFREDPGVGGADSAKNNSDLFPNTPWKEILGKK